MSDPRIPFGKNPTWSRPPDSRSIAVVGGDFPAEIVVARDSSPLVLGIDLPGQFEAAVVLR